MFQQVQDQVQWRADLLLAGRFEDMSREYLFPLPVYLEDRMIALQDPAEGIKRAAALRQILQERQVETLTITVRAVEVPRDGRFRVWADWHAASRMCSRSRRLGLVYYMRETQHGYRSEMLHYSSRSHRVSRATNLPRQQAPERGSPAGGSGMGVIDQTTCPVRTGSIYPSPYKEMMAGRSSLRLGDAGGLTQFGANLVILQPGAMSSLRHWHLHEDEFVMVVQGICTLVQDAGATDMHPGDCAAFKAGDPDGHHFINRSGARRAFWWWAPAPLAKWRHIRTSTSGSNRRVG